jgi:hypothetical protein
MEQMWWASHNRYIGYITNPIKGFFKRWKFKRDLKKKLNAMAPSHYEMILIAEFLYFLDIIYLFENNEEINGISGVKVSKSKNNKVYEYIIKVKVNKTQTIMITLNDPNLITIKIYNQSELRSKISFVDGEAEIHDKYDELLFIHLNDYLMNAFSKVLFKYI